MIRITNRLNQPLVINRGNGRVVHLLVGAATIVSEAEFESREIQSLVRQNALAATEVQGGAAVEKKPVEKPTQPPIRRKDS